jgi:hypothetical protein
MSTLPLQNMQHPQSLPMGPAPATTTKDRRRCAIQVETLFSIPPEPTSSHQKLRTRQKCARGREPKRDWWWWVEIAPRHPGPSRQPAYAIHLFFCSIARRAPIFRAFLGRASRVCSELFGHATAMAPLAQYCRCRRTCGFLARDALVVGKLIPPPALTLRLILRYFPRVLSR